MSAQTNKEREAPAGQTIPPYPARTPLSWRMLNLRHPDAIPRLAKQALDAANRIDELLEIHRQEMASRGFPTDETTET